MALTSRRPTSSALILASVIGLLGVPGLYAQRDTAHPDPGPKANLQIYLLIGQSNMAGRSPLLAADTLAIQ